MLEISKDRLVSLIASELQFDALNCGGVDNWSFYEQSRKDMLNQLAKEFNLEREDLTFYDVAEHIVKSGDYE